MPKDTRCLAKPIHILKNWITVIFAFIISHYLKRKGIRWKQFYEKNEWYQIHLNANDERNTNYNEHVYTHQE